MSKTAQEAFGGYLKELRHRRGLSLGDVAAISTETVQRLDKGALSRFEAGSQRLALGSASTLARVYGVEPGCLAERYELDAEAARSVEDPPADLNAHGLLEHGRRVGLERGRKWEAYVAFRDAVLREEELDDPGVAANARLNLAIVIRSLGKLDLALLELRHVSADKNLPAHRLPIALERMSSSQRTLGAWSRSEKLCEEARDAAEEFQAPIALAYVNFTRAMLAMEQREYPRALEDLGRASRAYRAAASAGPVQGAPGFEAGILTSLSEAYLHLEEFERAGRSARLAKSIASSAGLIGRAAYADIKLGHLAHHAGDDDGAELRWRHAADAGAKLGNRRLEFVARLQSYRLALSRKQIGLAEAQRKRLVRLAVWVAPTSWAYRKFRELAQ